MSKSLEMIKEQITRLKETKPAYMDILSFYEKIITKQADIRPSIVVPLKELEGELKNLQTKEGFPLINKEDFILDIPSSIILFEYLCEIGKNTTDKMEADIHAIEQSMRNGTIEPEELIKRHFDDDYLDKIARDLEINKALLKFLIHTSIKSSIDVNVDRLKDGLDLKLWNKGYCPVCGSLPQMSGLRGEGQRYFMCSFCSFKWQGDRIMCPFCENRDHKDLQYFYAEGNEVHRVDVCNKSSFTLFKKRELQKLSFNSSIENKRGAQSSSQ
ncbi:MAG: formate dehydrogenase accessory protein FdhE [Nitrospirae bacterium]|nr:formate dehydrogenase accessory protein FdhE [Nitrospirota bacterium]